MKRLMAALCVLASAGLAQANTLTIDHSRSGSGSLILPGDYSWVASVTVQDPSGRLAKGIKAFVSPREGSWVLDVRLAPTVAVATYRTVGHGTERGRKPELLATVHVTDGSQSTEERSRPRVQRPTQRALVVVLENSGVSSSLSLIDQVDAVQLPPLPYLVYTGPGPGMKFKLHKNESIASALTRLAGQLQETAARNAGQAPVQPMANGMPAVGDPAYPKYLDDLKDYNLKVAKNLAELANPANWTVKDEAFVAALDAASDFVIEELARGIQAAQVAGAYHRVVVLEDVQATPSAVLETIADLAPTYVMDIHVLTHGSHSFFEGHDGVKFSDASFFKPLRILRRQGPLFLRCVYQMNCRSGSLKQAWLDVGAEAVCGTARPSEGNGGESPLNYLPHQYVPFMDAWVRKNATFKEACDEAFTVTRGATTAVYAPFVSGAAAHVGASHLTVEGDPAIRLRTP